MPELHPGTTGRKSDQPSDPIAELPPLVSVTRTCEVLNISRQTVWRRVKDGCLQMTSGPGRKLVTKASIQRFAGPAQMKFNTSTATTIDQLRHEIESLKTTVARLVSGKAGTRRATSADKVAS
jgi:hypothetical protein